MAVVYPHIGTGYSLLWTQYFMGDRAGELCRSLYIYMWLCPLPQALSPLQEVISYFWLNQVILKNDISERRLKNVCFLILQDNMVNSSRRHGIKVLIHGRETR